MEDKEVGVIVCLSQTSWFMETNPHLPTLGLGKVISQTLEMQVILEPAGNFHSRNVMVKTWKTERPRLYSRRFRSHQTMLSEDVPCLTSKKTSELAPTYMVGVAQMTVCSSAFPSFENRCLIQLILLRGPLQSLGIWVSLRAISSNCWGVSGYLKFLSQSPGAVQSQAADWRPGF